MWRWITHAEFICCSFDHKSVRGSGGGRVAIECGRSADGEILGANGCECAWCAIGMIGMHASRARSGLSHARAGRVGRHRDGRAGHLARMDISATAGQQQAGGLSLPELVASRRVRRMREGDARSPDEPAREACTASDCGPGLCRSSSALRAGRLPRSK